jgi:membrane-bound lytic murein transglycosylase D
MRAIKHQGTNNYWELRLPRQTEEYVPQFMAALAISRDPAKYGFADVELDDPMKFDEVALKGAVDLRAIAKIADCSFEELKDLNPSARSSVMRGPNGITTIRVPEGRSEIIQRNLAAGAELPSVNLTVRHRVRRGETLRTIASHYSVSAVELARVNGLGRGRPLRRGMMLTVPSSMRAPKPEVIAAGTDDPRASTDYVPERRIGLPGKIDGNSVPIDRITHTVKRGETLGGIAAKYGVTSSDLRQWNRLQVGTVRTGTRLRIRSTADDSESTAKRAEAKPAETAADETAPKKPQPRLHTVVRGETLASIAGRYDVTITELRKWNELADADELEAGRVLEVSADAVADARTLDAPAGMKKATAKSAPSKVAAAPTKSKAGRIHIVRSGETITEIAGRYDVSVESLRKANKLKTTKLLVGQKLRLPA